MFDVRQIFESLPTKYGPYLELVDPSAQSGLETKARLRLRSLNIPYRAQVAIDRVGRVDLVIGDRFVVELDSKTWHTSFAAYTEDRRRDLALVERGYVVLRVTYDQVMNQWPAVERAVRAVVRRGEHRWAARHRH
ncbi:endonuclease domain-containing protein [Agreia sp.]|uniref:endonuclease domain-containing protein n=1 Tax=Agreia sp. TaxID=1872416 RepID=UPI0035BC3E98